MGKRLNTLYAESVSEDLNSPTHSTFLNDWCFRIWLKGPVLVVWKKKAWRFMSLKGPFLRRFFFWNYEVAQKHELFLHDPPLKGQLCHSSVGKSGFSCKIKTPCSSDQKQA